MNTVKSIDLQKWNLKMKFRRFKTSFSTWKPIVWSTARRSITTIRLYKFIFVVFKAYIKITLKFQILKRREEENILIRSQQQRRLNKMQDNINDLKNRIKVITKNGTAEELKSQKEIQRLQSSLFHLQAKANHFANVWYFLYNISSWLWLKIIKFSRAMKRSIFKFGRWIKKRPTILYEA